MKIVKSFEIVVCASGGGGNFQAIIDAKETLAFSITRLLVDRPCGAIRRAEQHGIEVVTLNASAGEEVLASEFDVAIPTHANLIVLAGFMPIVPRRTCEKWAGKIINTHPSLLPKHGGRGMYGVSVQESVMRAKDRFAGCTVHYVTPEIDAGEIIAQSKIEVNYQETPWELGGRVFKEENRLLVEVISRLITSNRRAC